MPPSNWQDFERLTLDWAKKAWKDEYAQRYGRQGQPQSGVDVFGFNNVQSGHIGVQCKKRTWVTKPGADAPSNTLTTDEIDEEIVAAHSFAVPLDRFLIATTGPRDEKLQKYVLKLNLAGTTPQVSLMFWDDFVEFLNNEPDLMYRYYENVLKYRQSYSAEQHFLRLVTMAFDRPAFKTPLHSENNGDDLLAALADTRAAIVTGRLVDRENKTIDEAPKLQPLPAELRQATKKLDSARNLLTQGLATGVIRQQDAWLMIDDHYLAKEINGLRDEALNLLNKLLRSKGMPTL